MLHVSQLNKLVVSALWLYLFWYRLHLLRTKQNIKKELRGRTGSQESKQKEGGGTTEREKQQTGLVEEPRDKKSAHNLYQSSYEEVKVWRLTSQGNSRWPIITKNSEIVNSLKKITTHWEISWRDVHPFLSMAERLCSLQISSHQFLRATPSAPSCLFAFRAFTSLILDPIKWEKNTDTFDRVPCWTPPTLLEDGQRYRGNQFKQGLDGGEVLGLDGENVQHLKWQDVTSGPFERRKWASTSNRRTSLQKPN